MSELLNGKMLAGWHTMRIQKVECEECTAKTGVNVPYTHHRITFQIEGGDLDGVQIFENLKVHSSELYEPDKEALNKKHRKRRQELIDTMMLPRTQKAFKNIHPPETMWVGWRVQAKLALFNVGNFPESQWGKLFPTTYKRADQDSE